MLYTVKGFGRNRISYFDNIDFNNLSEAKRFCERFCETMCSMFTSIGPLVPMEIGRRKRFWTGFEWDGEKHFVEWAGYVGNVGRRGRYEIWPNRE